MMTGVLLSDLETTLGYIGDKSIYSKTVTCAGDLFLFFHYPYPNIHICVGGVLEY